jgi:TPR repeat protein
MSLAWFHFSGAAVKRDPERALDLLAQADARGVPGAKERAARVRRGEAPSAGP